MPVGLLILIIIIFALGSWGVGIAIARDINRS